LDYFKHNKGQPLHANTHSPLFRAVLFLYPFSGFRPSLARSAFQYSMLSLDGSPDRSAAFSFA
jgi:hypothetical protein